MMGYVGPDGLATGLDCEGLFLFDRGIVSESTTKAR